MKSALLTRWEQVDALANEWNPLLRRSAADSVFLTWEWLQAWREASAERATPRVIVARDASGLLRGVVPLYVTRFRLLNVVPFRTLRFAADHHTGAEYPDVIVDPEHEKEAVDCLALGLREAKGWDCLWLPRVADWTGASERWRRFCEKAHLLVRTRPREFSAVELPADFGAYFAALSGNARSTLRRREKAVAAEGAVELAACERSDQTPEFLETLIRLNDARWCEAGQRGSFLRKPFEAEFYRRFVPLALERGWLRLIGLRVGGVIRAIQIGYVCNGVYHQMQEGFDPQAPAGIGNVLRARVIERLIGEGVRGYDFLGGFTEHKRRWLATPRTGVDVFAARPGLATRLLFAREVWPTGRFMSERHPTGLRN